MKKTTTVLTSLFAVSLVATLAFSQGSVLLRRDISKEMSQDLTFTTNSKMEMDLSEVGQGMQDITFNTSAKTKVSQVPGEDGKAKVTIAYSDVSVRMGGAMAEQGMGDAPDVPRSFTATATIDDRNRLSGVQTQGLTRQAASMLGSASSYQYWFIEFPENEVKPGESWNVTLPANREMGMEQGTMTVTFVGTKQQGDEEVNEFRVEGSVPMKMDISEMAGSQGMDITILMSGTMKFGGTTIMDSTNTKIISSTTSTSGDVNISAPDMGFSFRGKLSGSSEVK